MAPVERTILGVIVKCRTNFSSCVKFNVELVSAT